MADPILHIINLTHRYVTSAGPLTVLRECSLAIEPGELVALVGPSGSGKSTLLQVAGLLDAVQDGALEIAGVRADQASDTVRTKLRNKHIGFIYQFHNLLGELTAEENVAMPLRIAGVSAAQAGARAQQLLERLGLEERLHHRPAQLSGGEQQRVAIARALANRPALILADEPTGNLDPVTSESVTELFMEVAKEEGVAALIATHNIALAKRLTRAVTLNQGVLEKVRL